MPKQNRKQKKRNVNDAIVTIRKLTEQYNNIVNSHFLFGEWIEAMLPDEKYEDGRIDQAVRYFITQTLVYVNIFLRMYKDQKCIVVDKQEVIKSIKENEIYNKFEYDDKVTKEVVMGMLDKCLDKFFNNTIFPVVDKKDIEVEDKGK